MELTLPPDVGRTAFGADPAAYDEARPGYPPELYAALEAVCPEGARIFEIGPGTGQATAWLLGRIPQALAAVEPDGRLADFLAARFPAAELLREPFEEAELPEASFDLGAAATSFHWLDQGPALAKVARLLRPGGWWAMWWNVFVDPEDPDAFQEAARPLFRGLPRNASHPGDGALPFSLDTPARLAQLQAAGLVEARFLRIPWTHTMTTAQVLALAATFSPVSQADPGARERLLHGLAELAETRFHGRVERHFLTALYLARKP